VRINILHQFLPLLLTVIPVKSAAKPAKKTEKKVSHFLKMVKT